MAISEKQLEAALRKHGAVFVDAAKELKTTRQNVWQRVARSASLQAVVKEVEEELLDVGESHIIKGVRSGNEKLLTFYMDRKGKRRGYGTKVENSFSADTIEAFVAAFGGDLDKLRAARAALE